MQIEEHYENQAEVADRLFDAVEAYMRAIVALGGASTIEVDEVFGRTPEQHHEALRAAIWWLHDSGRMRVKSGFKGDRATLLLHLIS